MEVSSICLPWSLPVVLARNVSELLQQAGSSMTAASSDRLAKPDSQNDVQGKQLATKLFDPLLIVVLMLQKGAARNEGNRHCPNQTP
eukprot:3818925-Amphidinium_carterae.1